MKKEIKAYLEGEGWNADDLYDVIQVLDKIRDLRYEIENCRRGCYTGALTYSELQSKINRLAAELGEAADYIWAESLDARDEREAEEYLREEEEYNNRPEEEDED